MTLDLFYFLTIVACQLIYFAIPYGKSYKMWPVKFMVCTMVAYVAVKVAG